MPQAMNWQRFSNPFKSPLTEKTRADYEDISWSIRRLRLQFSQRGGTRCVCRGRRGC